MTLAERMQLERAKVQVRGFPAEVGQDRWQIGEPRQALRYGSRAKKPKRKHCLAGDCSGKVRGGSYCAHHQYLVDAGIPVDADLCRLTKAERRRVARLFTQDRFGGSLRLATKKTSA